MSIEEDRSRVDDLRGSPMAVGTMEEIIDDDHAIISTASGPEHYISIMSYVDKVLLEPGCQVLLHHKTHAIVGVLQDDADPLVNITKLDKAPTESYADVGGLENQISELIQRYLGDGPKLVRELFRVAEEHAPSIIFIDEIDAIGTKRCILCCNILKAISHNFVRYDSTSGGEHEIQRTMLELLN